MREFGPVPDLGDKNIEIEFEKNRGEYLKKIEDAINGLVPEELKLKRFEVPQSAKHHGEGPILKDHLAYLLFQAEQARGKSKESNFNTVISQLSEEEIKRFIIFHDIEKAETISYKFNTPESELKVIGVDYDAKSIEKVKDKDKKNELKAKRNNKIKEWLNSEGVDINNPLKVADKLNQEGITIQYIQHENISEEIVKKLAITPKERIRILLHMFKAQNNASTIIKKYFELNSKPKEQIEDVDKVELKNIYALALLDVLGSKVEARPYVEKDFDNFCLALNDEVKKIEQAKEKAGKVDLCPGIVKGIVGKNIRDNELKREILGILSLKGISGLSNIEKKVSAGLYSQIVEAFDNFDKK